MEKPAKCEDFPPQTTLPFYIKFDQSQLRKPIFSTENPIFFRPIPAKNHTNPYDFTAISRDFSEST